jgi:hypothetical protein
MSEDVSKATGHAKLLLISQCVYDGEEYNEDPLTFKVFIGCNWTLYDYFELFRQRC